jgi:hypothetical protein
MAILGGRYPISSSYVNLNRLEWAGIDIGFGLGYRNSASRNADSIEDHNPGLVPRLIWSRKHAHCAQPIHGLVIRCKAC